jgi:ribonucleotide monophosphatase NagD (HAD superfamily)
MLNPFKAYTTKAEATAQGILLDQFGVLHDGKNAYPTAIDAVRKLSEAGRKVVILSNSARRKLRQFASSLIYPWQVKQKSLP